MPSKLELETALRNAHKAGDEGAAKKLAVALKSHSGYTSQVSSSDGAVDKGFFQASIAEPALEFMAGANRATLNTLDFFGPDPVNASLNLLGSDKRVPTFSNSQTGHQASSGGFMDDGLARNIMGSAGEVSALALGSGAILREGAKQLPKLASKSESVGAGVLRDMGKITPKQDVVGGALAGTGSTIGEEVGGTPGSLLGSMALPALPSLIKTVPTEMMRRGLLGGESSRQVARNTINDFSSVGVMPLLGNVTTKNGVKGAENISANFLGGSRINTARQGVVDSVQTRLGSIADDINPKAGGDRAGRTIQLGITGKGGFIDRFQKQTSELWGKVDNAIGPNTLITPTNTRTKLDELVRPGSFGDVLNNPQLVKVKSAIEGADSLDYQTLKELRSVIGRKLGNSELISDIPRAELKQLYGAISEDIRLAATAKGESALKLFNRANTVTRAGHSRLDDFVERITNKVDLDKVFSAVTRGGDDVGTINAFKRSLKPDEWEVVVSNVIRRLGKSAPGQQNAAGDAFSVDKFLTDWNRLGNSKKALFSGSSKLDQYSRDLDKIARVAEKMKITAKEAANPSGTGQFVANLGTTAVLSGALVTGNMPLASTALVAITGNNLGSRLITNPQFVNWLARSSEMTTGALPEHLARLAVLAKTADDEDSEAMNQLYQELSTVGESQ